MGTGLAAPSLGSPQDAVVQELHRSGLRGEVGMASVLLKHPLRLQPLRYE